MKCTAEVATTTVAKHYAVSFGVGWNGGILDVISLCYAVHVLMYVARLGTQ